MKLYQKSRQIVQQTQSFSIDFTVVIYSFSSFIIHIMSIAEGTIRYYTPHKICF